MPHPEDQQDYDTIATEYDNIEKLPHSLISQELVLAALGDCTGQVILDLGGGSGLHARGAIDKGAARVDNVDISPEMLRNCSATEQRAGRKPGERIACYVGDATKSLAHLNLPGDADTPGLYDVVLMIWTFDHATTPPELEQMWANVSRCCRPGGKLIRLSSNDPRKRPSGSVSSGKYGVKLSEIEDVPGGIRYRFTVGFEKPFTAVATNMEANFDFGKAREMARRFGFDDLAPVPAAEMPVVRADPEFWQEFVDAKSFFVAVGNKIEATPA